MFPPVGQGSEGSRRSGAYEAGSVAQAVIDRSVTTPRAAEQEERLTEATVDNG
jgi:hypothetical protein